MERMERRWCDREVMCDELLLSFCGQDAKVCFVSANNTINIVLQNGRFQNESDKQFKVAFHQSSIRSNPSRSPFSSVAPHQHVVVGFFGSRVASGMDGFRE